MAPALIVIAGSGLRDLQGDIVVSFRTKWPILFNFDIVCSRLVWSNRILVYSLCSSARFKSAESQCHQPASLFRLKGFCVSGELYRGSVLCLVQDVSLAQGNAAQKAQNQQDGSVRWIHEAIAPDTLNLKHLKYFYRYFIFIKYSALM